MAEESNRVTSDHQSDHTVWEPESKKHEGEDKARSDSVTESGRHAHHTVSWLRAVPQWYSLGALVVAALTPFVSLAILLGVRGDPVWPNSGITQVVSPASLLSALLSFNSFLIAYAWSQGAASAWWRRTKSPNVTYEELHRIWAVGSSWVDALWCLNKPIFLHAVTFAVALNFVTGFALQGALNTPTRVVSKPVTITVPMAPTLDRGFSGQINVDHAIDLGGYYWQWIWQQVQNVVGSTVSQYAYFGSLNEQGQKIDLGYDQDATYTAYVDGAGFDYDCQPYQQPYDLLPTQARPVTHGRIFQSNFYWNSTNPNEIFFDIFWKEEGNCRGNFTGRRCVLRPATVQYPVSIAMRVPGITYPGPFFSLQVGTTRHDDRTKAILKPYLGEGDGNTTYGGMAQSFVEFFDAYIDIVDTYNTSNMSSYTTIGPLADTMIYGYSGNALYYCDITFTDSLSNLKYLDSLTKANQSLAVMEGDGSSVAGSVDLAELVLTTIRQSMFLSAVYTGSQGLSTNWNDRDDDWLPFNRSHYLPEVAATRHITETVYDFRWQLWAVSAFVTWVVTVLVLLSFGQWPGLLRTKQSLSPLETAQFFDAPALRNVRDDEGVDGILEDVGNLRVHDQRP